MGYELLCVTLAGGALLLIVGAIFLFWGWESHWEECLEEEDETL